MKSSDMLLVISIFLHLDAIRTLRSEKSPLKIAQTWISYKEYFKINVPIVEDTFRKRVFEENVKYIMEINGQKRNYTLDINPFAHLTFDEYLRILKLKEFNILFSSNVHKEKTSSFDMNSVGEIDWRETNKVTPVKDQEKCGACYAFSGVAAIESQIAIRQSHLVDLSVQQIIDCSKDFGNNGCDGGTFANTFKYVIENGIVPERIYPFVQNETECKKENTWYSEKYFIQGFTYLPHGNEMALSSKIYFEGPVAVGINASPRCFMFYKEGVYDSPECTSMPVNHAMLAVGIGSNPTNHYILKNSWGRFWGENGYMRLRRNAGNMCGVASTAWIPRL